MLTKNKGLAAIAVIAISTTSLASAATGDMIDTTMVSTGETNTTTTSLDSTATAATELKIQNVDASVAKTIKATFSSDVSKDGAVIKVMEDNKIASSIPDTTDTKKVTIVLNDDIKTSSTYTLFLVSDSEASMDITIPEALPTDAITNTNTDGEQNISTVKFIDSKTLELTFKVDVAGEPEFKLLREVKLASTDINASTITMITEDDMSASKAYTLTIVSLNDASGNPISAEDMFYEFNYTAPELEATASGAELNAASGATASGIENTAAQATELPDTGPKETILFFAAMLLALLTVLYYRKKIAR